jgi:type II secretory pathway component PulF
MPEFNYQASDKEGKIINGCIKAHNLDHAITLVRHQNLYIIDIKETVSLKAKKETVRRGERFFLTFFPQRIYQRTINAFIRELATLLEADMPLLKALRSLESQTKESRFKSIISNLANAVEEGEKFSEALGRFPRIFPKIFQAMVQSAEATGSLEVVLNRLADYSERRQKLKDRVKAALMYPAFVIIVAIAVLSILLVFVVPTFMNVFEEFGMLLPLPTRVLINVSFFIRRWWFILVIGGVLISLGSKGFLVRSFVKKKVDKIKLRLPLFGPLITKAIIANLTQTLSTLIANGVPILESLKITAETAENILFEEALMRAQGAVREGESLASTLAESKIFPELVIDMIKVGEDSAKLEVMLERIARNYEEKTETSINGLASILEPVLIVILGVIIGFVVFAVFLPLLVLVRGIY